MKTLTEKISQFAGKLGIQICKEFSPELLIPDPAIRSYCQDNLCGKYGKHYMCPPLIGSLEEISLRLRQFNRGYIFQFTHMLDVRNDPKGVELTKITFHQHILSLEEFLKENGIQKLWGMIGGSCALCPECGARENKPCSYPEQARTSLEAISVNVIKLLDTLGLPSRFYSDRITWTGGILF